MPNKLFLLQTNICGSKTFFIALNKNFLHYLNHFYLCQTNICCTQQFFCLKQILVNTLIFIVVLNKFLYTNQFFCVLKIFFSFTANFFFQAFLQTLKIFPPKQIVERKKFLNNRNFFFFRTERKFFLKKNE